jgi:hypothetical protein
MEGFRRCSRESPNAIWRRSGDVGGDVLRRGGNFRILEQGVGEQANVSDRPGGRTKGLKLALPLGKRFGGVDFRWIVHEARHLR